MSSLAKHRGKYLLVCRIHPWIDLTSTSPQACPIACRRGIRACGGGHICAFSKRKKNPGKKWQARVQVRNFKMIMVGDAVVQDRPEQPNGNLHYPRQQQTWAALGVFQKAGFVKTLNMLTLRWRKLWVFSSRKRGNLNSGSATTIT